MVEEVPKDEARIFFLLAEAEKKQDGYKYAFEELGKEAAKLLKENEPLPESLRGWLVNCFQAMGAGEEPNKAFNFEESARTANKYDVLQRNIEIYIDVRDLIRETGNKTKAFNIVGKKRHKSPRRIGDIYYSVLKNVKHVKGCL